MPAHPIDHGDLDIALEAQVLQPIVADDDIARVVFKQTLGCLPAVRSYGHRALASLR
jgi:hypothetical protein